jgi:hypothetical protein
MTLLRGCDSAYPPDQAQIDAAKKDGCVWWGGYFGGVDALNVWTKEQFLAVSKAGFKLAPIWVPQQIPATFNPADCIAGMLDAAKTYGISRGSCLFLDAEPALFSMLVASKATQEQLAKGISDGGYHLVIYGGPGNLVVPEWLASWYGSQWPHTVPPGAAGTLVAWQWSDKSMTVGIPNADLDVMTGHLLVSLWDPAIEPTPVETKTVETKPVETAPANPTVTTVAHAPVSGDVATVTHAPTAAVTVADVATRIADAIKAIDDAVSVIDAQIAELRKLP